MTSKKYTTWGEVLKNIRHVSMIDIGSIEPIPDMDSPYEPVSSDSGKRTFILDEESDKLQWRAILRDQIAMSIPREGHGLTEDEKALLVSWGIVYNEEGDIVVSDPKSRSGPPVKAEKTTVAPPLPQEMPLVGLEKIADFMNLSLDQVKRLSKELQRQGIFIKQLKGKPPNRRRWIMAYPSSLKSYMENKSKEKK